MKKRSILWPLLGLLILLAVPVLSCGPLPSMFTTGPTDNAQDRGSPVPGTEELASPVAVGQAPSGQPRSPAVESVPQPPDTPLPVPTATPVPPSSPTPVREAAPSRTPLPARSQAAPRWPASLVITATEIEELARTYQVDGLEMKNLRVRFGAGSMTLTADSLRYSVVSLKNVVVEGRLSAVDGVVRFDATRLQPSNLVTAAIPTLVNQVLARLVSDWYVENLHLEPGQLVIQVRPG